MRRQDDSVCGMPLLARLVATLLLVSAVAACGPQQGGQPGPVPQATVNPCSPWGCDQAAHFGAASEFISRHPGTMSIMVTDRQTGASWQGGDPHLRTWAGSTPKLAMIVYLLEQHQAGKLQLTQRDRDDIHAILSQSDNDAADGLWDRYVDSAAIMQRWQSTYGMTNASYVDDFQARWGWVKLGPPDLANLMAYILNKLDPTDRQYIVDRMGSVGSEQQWGVWGAGASLKPGVKDGWDYDNEKTSPDIYRWVLSTVGFVGPGQRYIVAAQYDMPPSDLPADGTCRSSPSCSAGVHAISDLVATVFGSAVPAPAVVPSAY
jgi:hypothetical protein